jgi:hypothetical protein
MDMGPRSLIRHPLVVGAFAMVTRRQLRIPFRKFANVSKHRLLTRGSDQSRARWTRYVQLGVQRSRAPPVARRLIELK